MVDDLLGRGVEAAGAVEPDDRELRVVVGGGVEGVADPVGLRGVELAAELDRGDLGVGRLRERLRRPEQRQREQAESGNEGEGAGAHDRIIRRFAKGTYEGLSAYFSMSASRAA